MDAIVILMFPREAGVWVLMFSVRVSPLVVYTLWVARLPSQRNINAVQWLSGRKWENLLVLGRECVLHRLVVTVFYFFFFPLCRLFLISVFPSQESTQKRACFLSLVSQNGFTNHCTSHAISPYNLHIHVFNKSYNICMINGQQKNKTEALILQNVSTVSS